MQTRLKWHTFRWQIAAALLLLMVVCWRIVAGKQPLPEGTGPAGPSVPIEPFQRVWSTDKIVLLGLGDSVTKGFGASPKHSYFELLEKNDDARYPDMKGRDLRSVFSRLEVHNYAMSGTVSEEHLKKQLPRISRFSTDVKGIVVITTGGNDVIHNYGRTPPRDGAMYGCTYEQAVKWTENFRDRLKALIEGVTERFPGGCEIFLANIYDPTDGVGDVENANAGLPRWSDGLRVLALMNEVIADVSRDDENVHRVDIRSHFLGHGIHCRDRSNKHHRAEDPHYWYYSNLEDPNDRGYDAIRRLFLIEMVKVFTQHGVHLCLCQVHVSRFS
jgi:lysophospholipase L1-like esterase